MIRGKESTLFVLPSEVGDELSVKNDDALEFVIRNGTLVIRKIDHDYMLNVFGNGTPAAARKRCFE